MDNTMDINLGDNNKMESLSFHWNVILKDGTHIFQFNKDGTEHKFSEVLNRMNDLVYFNLTNNNGKMFSVNLINGLIGYNKLEFPYIESTEKKGNIRLIYFRRNKIDFNEKLEQKSHTITFHLGYQYLLNGTNRKIILEIDEQGNWILGV